LIAVAVPIAIVISISISLSIIAASVAIFAAANVHAAGQPVDWHRLIGVHACPLCNPADEVAATARQFVLLEYAVSVSVHPPEHFGRIKPTAAGESAAWSTRESAPWEPTTRKATPGEPAARKAAAPWKATARITPPTVAVLSHDRKRNDRGDENSNRRRARELHDEPPQGKMALF
jgi:hypothetical protein